MCWWDVVPIATEVNVYLNKTKMGGNVEEPVHHLDNVGLGRFQREVFTSRSFMHLSVPANTTAQLGRAM